MHANDLASDAKGQQDPLPPTATAASRGNGDQLCRTKHDISYVPCTLYSKAFRPFSCTPVSGKMISIVRVQGTKECPGGLPRPTLTGVTTLDYSVFLSQTVTGSPSASRVAWLRDHRCV